MHLIRKQLKSGDRWYVYAWRGGPCVHTQDGARPVITADIARKAALASSRNLPGDTLAGQIQAYKKAPEYRRLADSTKTEYNRLLDLIWTEFGKAKLAAFNDWRMRAEIVGMRDEFSDTPRKADAFTAMFSTLLQNILHRGLISVNVASDIPKLYKSTREDVIWEEGDIDALRPHCKDHLWNVIELARLTGLRTGDLIALKWSHISQNAIVMTTNKRKKRAVVPMTHELRSLLDGIDRISEHVLLSSRGTPWSSEGLKTVFGRAKKLAGVDKNFHDFRGTFVTFLAMKDLTDEQIAKIVGWSDNRVAQIRARYVDEAQVVIELGRRLSQ